MTNRELKQNTFKQATANRKAKMEQQLLEIAKKHSAVIAERGDLEERGCDSEDFIELSVWSLKAMLEEAYQLGRQNN